MATIRRADPADIPGLVSLRSEFLAELRRRPHEGLSVTSPAELEASTAEYYARALPSGQYVAWIAEEAGEAVAMAGCFYFERPPMERPGAFLEGRIINVYTRPGSRGRGLAYELVRELVEHARSLGVRRLRLGATPQGRSVYERLGFRPVSSEMELRLLRAEQPAPST